MVLFLPSVYISFLPIILLSYFFPFFSFIVFHPNWSPFCFLFFFLRFLSTNFFVRFLFSFVSLILKFHVVFFVTFTLTFFLSVISVFLRIFQFYSRLYFFFIACRIDRLIQSRIATDTENKHLINCYCRLSPAGAILCVLQKYQSDTISWCPSWNSSSDSLSEHEQLFSRDNEKFLSRPTS